MKFGLIFDFRNPAQWRRPWAEFYARTLDLAVEAEARGYDHVWLTEHHFVDDGYLPSIVPVAAAIAARTTRIRIGSDIMILPFQDPVRIAEDLAVVDILSGGRFDLGVGAGYRAEEFRAIGMSARERHARTRESVELIQRLWTEDHVTFKGRSSPSTTSRCIRSRCSGHTFRSGSAPAPRRRCCARRARVTTSPPRSVPIFPVRGGARSRSAGASPRTGTSWHSLRHSPRARRTRHGPPCRTTCTTR